MRFFAILLVLLLGGLGWALWRGIDLGADRLTDGSGDLAVTGVERTAHQDEEPADPPVLRLEDLAPDAPTAGEPAAEAAADAPAPAAPTASEERAATAPPTAAPAPPAAAGSPTPTAKEAPAQPPAPAASPAASRAARAAPPEAAEPPAAGLPEPLPAKPLDPADALAALAPDLAVPARPPVRRSATPQEATEAAPPAASAAPAGRRRIAGDRVNLREGPGTDADSLGLLSDGDPVEVLATRGDWMQVRTADGREGWVAARFLAPPG